MPVFAKTSKQGSGFCRETGQGHRPAQEGPLGPLGGKKGTILSMIPVQGAGRSGQAQQEFGIFFHTAPF